MVTTGRGRRGFRSPICRNPLHGVRGVRFFRCPDERRFRLDPLGIQLERFGLSGEQIGQGVDEFSSGGRYEPNSDHDLRQLVRRYGGIPFTSFRGNLRRHFFSGRIPKRRKPWRWLANTARMDVRKWKNSKHSRGKYSHEPVSWGCHHYRKDYDHWGERRTSTSAGFVRWRNPTVLRPVPLL